MPKSSDGVVVAMRVHLRGEDPDGYVQTIEPGTLILSKPGTEEIYQFKYSHALAQVDNPQIYDLVGKPLVNSVLEGFNCTMLAYGQTGAGKTFTMLGPEGNLRELPERVRGVMPRALQQLFAGLEQQSRVSAWTMEMTYIEVYCEAIRDLLSPERKQVDVVEVNGTMHLKGITPSPVASISDAECLLERAQKLRHVSATDMNARSSRSHTVLTVWINFRDTQGVSLASKLNLVDLSGSERRKAAGDKNAQTNREGDAINKSLLALQTVVLALGTKGTTPSYRSSKLTHFLKDSLGGNCKTTLVACAIGDPSKMPETLATCRFAENMMKVAVTAKKNMCKEGAGMSVVGNKLKLDPTVIAIVEKRVADQVAIERAKLVAQYQQQGSSIADGVSECDDSAGCDVARASATNPSEMLQVGHDGSHTEQGGTEHKILPLRGSVDGADPPAGCASADARPHRPNSFAPSRHESDASHPRNSTDGRPNRGSGGGLSGMGDCDRDHACAPLQLRQWKSDSGNVEAPAAGELPVKSPQTGGNSVQNSSNHLAQHDVLQRPGHKKQGRAMVFLSAMDHASVVAALGQKKGADQALPLSLDEMPKL